MLLWLRKMIFERRVVKFKLQPFEDEKIKLNLPLVVYKLDIYPSVYNFENAVDVALIDKAEFGITKPLEARSDNFDSFGAHHIKPLCLKQVFGDVAVYILRLWLSDKQFFVPVVEVEL